MEENYRESLNKQLTSICVGREAPQLLQAIGRRGVTDTDVRASARAGLRVRAVRRHRLRSGPVSGDGPADACAQR